MKVKKKLSPLLICLIILSALLLVIAFFVLSKEKVDLKPDSDTSTITAMNTVVTVCVFITVKGFLCQMIIWYIRTAIYM